MWLIKQNLAIAFIPKAGTNSIRKWLGEYEMVENEDSALLECEQRVAFIRHPLERLNSVYSYFKGLDEDGIAHSVKAPTEDWENFVDFILQNKDPHWDPQAEHTGEKWNIVYRFENISHITKEYQCNPFPWHNKTKRNILVPTNYRLQELTTMYSRDFFLWGNAPIYGFM